jgi:hypothetical protein
MSVASLDLEQKLIIAFDRKCVAISSLRHAAKRARTFAAAGMQVF